MPEEGSTPTTETSVETTVAPEAAVAPPATQEQAGTTEQTPAEVQTSTDANAEIPESYSFTVPEGMTLDQGVVDSFTPLAKELGLTQANAQKLADWYAGQTKASQEAFTKQQDAWYDEVAKDKELGGEHFEANCKAANEAFVKLAKTEEIEWLKSSGLANFPPLMRLMLRAQKLMAEDKFVSGKEGSTATEGNMFLPGSKRT